MEIFERDIYLKNYGKTMGDYPIELVKLAEQSGSVTQLSIWYSDVMVWCNQHCPGKWQYGWTTYTVEGINFFAVDLFRV